MGVGCQKSAKKVSRIIWMATYIFWAHGMFLGDAAIVEAKHRRRKAQQRTENQE